VPAVKASEDIIDDINKLRNRAKVCLALRHLANIVRKIINNPMESGPRKIFKSDEVLVEELFVLPEAVKLLRAMGFHDEGHCYFYDGTKSEELAEMHAMLTRKREVFLEAVSREQAPEQNRLAQIRVEAHSRQKVAEMMRVQEQLRQEPPKPSQDARDMDAPAPVQKTLSEDSGNAYMEEDDRDDALSDIGEDQMKAFVAK
jgi:hypothetical protein